MLSLKLNFQVIIIFEFYGSRVKIRPDFAKKGIENSCKLGLEKGIKGLNFNYLNKNNCIETIFF